jgi:hypothetical protein
MVVHGLLICGNDQLTPEQIKLGKCTLHDELAIGTAATIHNAELVNAASIKQPTLVVCPSKLAATQGVK